MPNVILQDPQAPIARVSTIKASEDGAGIGYFMHLDGDALKEMMRQHVQDVLSNSMAVWTPEDFMEHNEMRWSELQDELRNRSHSNTSMPFIFADVISIVRSEAPALFSEDTSIATVTICNTMSCGCTPQSIEALCKQPAIELARTLLAIPHAERQGRLVQSVINVVKDLTSEGSLVAETPLMEAGIDSLAATEVVSRLSDLSGVSLEPTLIFAHPSARQIAAHLLELLGVSEPAVQPAPSQASAVSWANTAPSSIIVVRAFCGR